MNSEVDFSGWHILAVDDEPDNLDLITTLMEYKGAIVEKASNGQEAYDLVMNGLEPTVILLDLAMPHMDGWELHQKLRSDARLDNVPIVALTALAMTGDAEKVVEAGFDGYITKPFRVDSLLLDLQQSVEKFFASKSA